MSDKGESEADFSLFFAYVVNMAEQVKNKFLTDTYLHLAVTSAIMETNVI